MAKQAAKQAAKAVKKRARRSVDVSEAHIAECPACSQPMLILTGDIEQGDHFDCTDCGQPLRIGERFCDCYSGPRPATLDVRSL